MTGVAEEDPLSAGHAGDGDQHGAAAGEATVGLLVGGASMTSASIGHDDDVALDVVDGQPAVAFYYTVMQTDLRGGVSSRGATNFPLRSHGHGGQPA